MYGMNVHNAVIDAKDEKSGITIHLVDGSYDTGDHLFQASVNVDVNDSPDSLAAKIHKLEYQHFPKAIEDYVLNFF